MANIIAGFYTLTSGLNLGKYYKVLIPFILIVGTTYIIYQNREALSEIILMNSPATTLITLIYYYKEHTKNKSKSKSDRHTKPRPGGPEKGDERRPYRGPGKHSGKRF